MAVSSLRLDDVVNYLNSPAGRSFVEQVATEVEQPTTGPGAKPDVFRILVADALVKVSPAERLAAIPMAVATALSRLADGNGEVAVDAVQKGMGSFAGTMALQLAERLAETPDLKNRRFQTKYNDATPEVAALIARSARRNDIRERMPLLPELTRALGGPDALQGFRMASMGHLFPSTPILYEELEKNGLSRNAHLVTGKGYSRNPDVIIRMAADGWQVDQRLLTGFEYGRNVSMEEKRAVETLSRMFAGVDPNDKTQKFLILDEGGHMTLALHTVPELRKYASLCHIAEQTEHGIIQIKEQLLAKGIDLLCPVVNCAQSRLKKVFESPMIGESVVSSIENGLKELNPELKIGPPDTAIVGFGAVNQQVVKALLRRGTNPKDIWVYDIDPAKMELAKAWGLSTGTRPEVYEHGQLFISATGHTTITPAELDMLPDGAIVVNAGSGNTELGMNELGVNAPPTVAPTEDGRRWRRVSQVGDALEEMAIVGFMEQALVVAAQRLPGAKTAAIDGYDADAKIAISMLLQHGYPMSQLRVCDPDPARQEEARKAGLTLTTAEGILRHSPLIITNDPKRSMSAAAMRMSQQGTIFVNHCQLEDKAVGKTPNYVAQEGITAPVEKQGRFADWQSHFRGYGIDTGEARTASGYRHRVLRAGRGNEVLVMRSGFVINMVDDIPPEYVQLIRGMLLSGCLQAAKETKPGLVELDPDAQKFIERRMARYLKGVHRTLEEPDFRGLDPGIY
jgi:S-adenosylhomocysteine hydrolase